MATRNTTQSGYWDLPAGDAQSCWYGGAVPVMGTDDAVIGAGHTAILRTAVTQSGSSRKVQVSTGGVLTVIAGGQLTIGASGQLNYSGGTVDVNGGAVVISGGASQQGSNAIIIVRGGGTYTAGSGSTWSISGPGVTLSVTIMPDGAMSLQTANSVAVYDVTGTAGTVIWNIFGPLTMAAQTRLVVDAGARLNFNRRERTITSGSANVINFASAYGFADRPMHIGA